MFHIQFAERRGTWMDELLMEFFLDSVEDLDEAVSALIDETEG